MLRSISITNFKSYRYSDLPLSPLTLLIGANASGKSNAIEAIRLLSWLASGRRLDDILTSVQDDEQLIRGSVVDLTYNRKGEFMLGCHLDIEDWYNLLIRIGVNDEGLRILYEEIRSPFSNVPLYAVDGPVYEHGSDILVKYNNFARGGVKPKIPCTNQQAVFTQLGTPARFSHRESQKTIPKIVENYRRSLEAVLFRDPVPGEMRKYSFKTDKKLKGNGSNLSSVLFHLWRNQDCKQEILDFVRALPEQDIKKIDFIETPRNEVMIQLEESLPESDDNNITWDSTVLSDGTLRVLAIAAALMSAPEGSLVVIEEIDNGVHPSRAKMLLENILRISTRRDLKVLLSTHNPALLDALPHEAIPNVVCCYRHPKTGDSRLIQLEKISEYPELIAQGPLGQLMTKGIIDRYLKNPRTKEEIKANALSFLDALSQDEIAP